MKNFTLKNARAFLCAEEAVAYIHEIYEKNTGIIKEAFARFKSGEPIDQELLATATYPAVAFHAVESVLKNDFDSPLSYGLLDDAGEYATTLTAPHLFHTYSLEQIKTIIDNHGVPAIVGESTSVIPLPYVVDYVDNTMTHHRVQELKQYFPLPDLYEIHDHIANDTYDPRARKVMPLSLFTAERADYSLGRLHHYTGTHPRFFQRFILLTNYQRYAHIFKVYAEKALNDPESGYTSFVAPHDRVFDATTIKDYHEEHERLPQRPAYHLTRADGNGITFVNIGVGPSNAKNITDHLAVLRPHCWIMIGHCAGLRRRQALGDYVLAHAYMRLDQVLNKDLPLWVPIPPLAEIQLALQRAFGDVTGLKGKDLKYRLRTGTVATTDDRNWELRAYDMYPHLRQSRAIAVDMESATIAANGFRFRVPYGTLLCVSDKPIHGELKMRGAANAFYQERLHQHLEIGIQALEGLRLKGVDRLHSRKLRGFCEVIFR